MGAEAWRVREISSYRLWRGVKSRFVKLLELDKMFSLKREPRVVEPVHFYI
jgi:hypothetical protein